MKWQIGLYTTGVRQGRKKTIFMPFWPFLSPWGPLRGSPRGPKPPVIHLHVFPHTMWLQSLSQRTIWAQKSGKNHFYLYFWTKNAFLRKKTQLFSKSAPTIICFLAEISRYQPWEQPGHHPGVSHSPWAWRYHPGAVIRGFVRPSVRPLVSPLPPVPDWFRPCIQPCCNLWDRRSPQTTNIIKHTKCISEYPRIADCKEYPPGAVQA